MGRRRATSMQLAKTLHAETLNSFQAEILAKRAVKWEYVRSCIFPPGERYCVQTPAVVIQSPFDPDTGLALFPIFFQTPRVRNENRGLF
jgi:hypothetical protein